MQDDLPSSQPRFVLASSTSLSVDDGDTKNRISGSQVVSFNSLHVNSISHCNFALNLFGNTISSLWVY